MTGNEIIEFHSEDGNQKKHFEKGLDEFVQELVGSDVVVTDSAATVALSIVFNVPCVVDYKENDNDLKTLVQDLNLYNRCFGNITEVSQALDCDYYGLRNTVQKWREMSAQAIQNLINAEGK